ncbi:MAG: hypothetical protein AB7P22_14600 [Vicinamibacterales bacterium]
MQRLLLRLDLDESAVFSARAATEGDHRTLSYIPGSALLGYAAGRCYRSCHDPFAVFHSGRLRFSNAVPVTGSGVPAYPAPQVLREPKHARGGIRKAADGSESALDPGVVVIGEAGHDEVLDARRSDRQLEAMRGFFVGADLSIVRPPSARRLRTALDSGRAKAGQLFGYTHLEAGLTFAATIEADQGIEPADWQRIVAAFSGAALSLGRSRHAEYGGEIRCCVEELAASEPDPVWSTGRLDGAEGVVVWALSDLAIEDAETGFATFAPRLQDLFPDAGLAGNLDRSRSVVTQRRYAPWNGYLGGRDSERAVIEAGSVLWFSEPMTLPATASVGDLSQVGRFREAGLGRIWLNPPLLSGWGRAPVAVPRAALKLPTLTGAAIAEPSIASDTGATLVSWLQQRAGTRGNKQKRDDLSSALIGTLVDLYRAVHLYNGAGAGPSRSQWGDVISTLQSASDPAAVLRALFEGERGRGSAWNQSVMVGGQSTTIKDWLRSEMESASGLDLATFVETFEAVAKKGQQLAQEPPST